VAVGHYAIQLVGFPGGAVAGVYPADEVEHDRRIGRKPGATPLDTGTVSAGGEVNFSLPGGEVLPQGEYAIHATVDGQERWTSFRRGVNPKEAAANQKREEAQRKRLRGQG
jgi:hypothetical protein